MITAIDYIEIETGLEGIVMLPDGKKALLLDAPIVTELESCYLNDEEEGQPHRFILTLELIPNDGNKVI